MEYIWGAEQFNCKSIRGRSSTLVLTHNYALFYRHTFVLSMWDYILNIFTSIFNMFIFTA